MQQQQKRDSTGMRKLERDFLECCLVKRVGKRRQWKKREMKTWPLAKIKVMRVIITLKRARMQLPIGGKQKSQEGERVCRVKVGKIPLLDIMCSKDLRYWVKR